MRTYNYDYSFALSINEVNKTLKDNLENVDLELKYSGNDPQSGASIKLNAKMAPWQIIKGGQNSLLRFSLPFSKGSMSIQGPISNSYDLTNITVLIEITLGWLGTGNTQQAKGSGDFTKLVFSPEKTNDPDNPGYVSVINILDPNNKLDTISTSLIRSYTATILFENKDKINLILANVFPVPNKVSSWLKPYKWQYYYSTGEYYDALCFLCMMSDKPWPEMPAFDSTSLIKDNNAVILISQEIFFRHVVLPSIKNTFPKGNFDLNVNQDESCSIINRGSFDIKVNKGTITVNSFKLVTNDSGKGISIKTSGGGPLKYFFGLNKLPNASYSWDCKNNNNLVYKGDKVSFQKDNHPETHHHQQIYWYDWVLMIVTGIFNLPELIALIVNSINDFSNEVNIRGIGNVNNKLENSVSNSLVNLSNLISWSEKGGQKFKTANAGLNGALYIYGNLN